MASGRKQKIELGPDEVYDQSRRAESVLDYVLQGEVEEKRAQSAGEQVDVNAERRARPVIDIDTGRTASRVLFVTSEASVLSSNSAEQQAYVKLEAYFDEVHVLALVNRKGENASMRSGERTWVYSVHGSWWWLLPWYTRSTAEEMLIFNDSVRPDIVVGTDPYEAGLAAYLIAGSFARPLQIHVKEDFMQSSFLHRDDRNSWRRRIAKYVLKRTKSVRATTSAIKEMLEKRFKKIVDLEVIPRFYNFEGYLSAAPSSDIHDVYKDFSFIMLAFAPLTADSHLHDTIAALNRTLHNPRIGLVVVGTGPGREIFNEKVKILGIERNVVFLSSLTDPVSYMKTADALIETGTSRDSEVHVLRAAAAGLPIIAVETELRNDLFKDGVSALLCPKDDVQCISQKFTKFINSPALRKQFIRQGQQVAKDRLIEDADSYYRAYRDSIEVILETVVPEPEASHEESHEIPHEMEDGRVVDDSGMSYPAEALQSAEEVPAK